jgi:hypothetical protein
MVGLGLLFGVAVVWWDVDVSTSMSGSAAKLGVVGTSEAFEAFWAVII